MAGLHAQSKRKREKRAVDMSRDEQLEPTWVRPPPEECEQDDPLTLYPTGADPEHHRMKVRIESHVRTHAIVEFAVIQQTFDRGKWRDVYAVDSCHDSDVHAHRYARSTDQRAGEPEILMPITCEADVQKGYNQAYDHVERAWSANYARWHDA